MQNFGDQFIIVQHMHSLLANLFSTTCRTLLFTPESTTWWDHAMKMPWKCSLHYWSFVRGIHWSLEWISLTKGQWFRAVMVLFVSLNKLLSKQLNCLWFEMPWLSCNFAIMRHNFVNPSPCTMLRCGWAIQHRYVFDVALYLPSGLQAQAFFPLGPDSI